MGTVRLKNRKYIGMFLLIVMLLCAVLVPQPDTTNRIKNIPESSDTILCAASTYFSIIANVEEITPSSSQISSLHQAHFQKSKTAIIGIVAVICNIALLPMCTCLLFPHIYLLNIGNCQRYIIKYIHNIDGEKA